MAHSPTHDQVIQLVNRGRLFLDYGHRGEVCFYIRHGHDEMSGRLCIRRDWSEGPDDRPGLMPIMSRLSNAETGYNEEGYEPAIAGISHIYEALRERMSPRKLHFRQEGRWMLNSFGSPPECG